MVEVNFSKQAVDDIDEIAQYWARFSEKTAMVYVQKIYATVELLAQFPHLGRMSSELITQQFVKYLPAPIEYFTT